MTPKRIVGPKMSWMRAVFCLSLLLTSASPARPQALEPGFPILSQEQVAQLQSELQVSLLEAFGKIEDQVRLAMARIDDPAARGVLDTALHQLEAVSACPSPDAVPSGDVKMPIVWCWIDNCPNDPKYSPCVLPFLLGPTPPFKYPLTASTSLQKAIDQASIMAQSLKRPIPVIVLPSFFPKLLQIITFGLCGDENYEGYEEQIEMKPGVIVIGVPLLLEPVKIICPSPGPAVAATGPFGKSTSFQDVLDELELELLQIAEELTNSIISSAANALGKRFENLLIDGAQTGVVNALDEFFEFTGTGRRVFSDFLMTSFKFLDEQVIAAGDTLGVSMEPFSPVAAFFDDDYEDSAKLREDIKNGIREAVLKGLTGSKDPWTSASPLFAAQYPESATARLMIGRAAEKFTDKLTDFLKKRTTRLNGKISQALSSSPAVPDATTAKTVKQTVKDEVLAPVRDQINKEIQHAVAEMELTSLGSDVEELAQEAADALAEWLYEDVVVGLTMDAYKSLAKKTNEGMADFFDTIFDPGSGFQFGPGLATMGQELGEEMADTVADTLETAISAIPGSENAFSNLADEIDFSLKELGNQALDIAEGVATRVMTKVAGMILNYGFLFDFEITHKDGMSGPGVLVDGYALVSILNEITSNMAGGGLSDMGLPDDGSSGGGVIIQGFVPSIFIFNRAVKNSALQDGAGVYFGEGFGALWLFNTVERNTAGNRGGGTFFDGGSISGFFFNEVDKNSAQLGGGGYLSSDASILFWNTFNANQSSTDGGGLAIDGDLLILYNDIVGNVASRRGGGVAVIEGGDPSLWNNRISGNMGTVDGGGIAVLGDGTNPDIGPSNRIRENLTGGRGGGIFVDGFAEPEITGNRIAGNFAPVSGGGIYWAAPGEAAEKVAGTAEAGKTLSQAPAPRRPDITSNLVLRNSTYGNGGGISLIQEFVPLANNRVMRNQARGEGGGVYIVNVNQASLSNNGLGSNMADGSGGGLRCDSVNQIVLSGNWFVGNLTGISGGGMAVDHAISVTSGSDAFEGNHAPLLGGGIWIENSGLLALTSGTILGNRSDGEGGGVYAYLVDRLQCNGTTFKRNAADPLGSPKTGAGRGGGLAAQAVNNFAVVSCIFDENTSSGHGGGLLADHIPAAEILSSVFQNNLADSTLGNGPVADPRGGGAYFIDCDSVRIGSPGSGVTFLSNAADYGGGVAFKRCASVRVQASHFEKNTTDTDSDGYGDGGGGLAEGPRTFILLGGDALLGEGNSFKDNTAGTPPAFGPPRMANGGAFAIEASAHGDVFGNTYEGNACTYTGGALYVSETVPVTRIGLAPPEPPDTADYHNLAKLNCVQEKRRIRGILIPTPTPTPPVTWIPDPVTVCDIPSVTDLSITDQVTGTEDPFTFAGISPGRLVITAGVVPQDQDVTVVPHVNIEVEGGVGIESSDQIGSVITEYTGGTLPFSVTVTKVSPEPTPTPAVPSEKPVISFEVASGNPCQAGPFQMHFTLHNAPSGEPIQFINAVFSFDPSRINVTGIVAALGQGYYIEGSVEDNLIYLFAHAEREAKEGALAVFNMESLLATEQGPLQPPLEVLDVQMFTYADERIDPVIEVPEEFVSCPEGVPFVPETPCLPHTLWVTVRNLDEADLPEPERPESGARPWSYETNLILAHIDTDGGRVCPAIPVFGHSKTRLPINRFSFAAASGDIADITVTTTDLGGGLTAPMISLSDPAGNPVGVTDTSDSPDVFYAANVPLAQSGSYSLALVTVPEVLEREVATRFLVEVAINGQKISEQTGLSVGNFIDVDTFTFSGSTGDVADISVNSLTVGAAVGTPLISLTGPSGTAINVTDSSTDPATFEVNDLVLMQSGTYSINVYAIPERADTPVSSLYTVDVTLNGEDTVKQDGCTLPQSPVVDTENGEFEAAFQIAWPDIEPRPDLDWQTANLPGSQSRAVPPWPPRGDWRPTVDLPSLSRDIGSVEIPSVIHPARLPSTGTPGEIITYRGGYLGIVNAPQVIVDANTVEGNYAEAYGGGAFVTLTDPTVRIGTPEFGNVWTLNQSIFGGGIAIQNANPVVQNNIIGRFDAPNIARFGGGLYLESSYSLVGGLGDNRLNLINANVAGFRLADGEDLPPIPSEITSAQDSYYAGGGGVFVVGGGPILRNNFVVENSVAFQPSRGNEPLSFPEPIRLGGGGIGVTGVSSALIDAATIIANQVIPLSLDSPDELTLELRGGGMLVDDSIFPASAPMPGAKVTVENIQFTGNYIQYGLESESQTDQSALSLHMAGGAVAARRAHDVTIHGSTMHSNIIERDYSSGVLAAIRQGEARGGAVSIEDDSQVDISESFILQGETAPFDANVIGLGGGVSVAGASASINSNWIIGCRSSHDGGAIHLRSALGQLDGNTIVEALAIQRGSGLFIQTPIDGAFSITNNIIESFGGADSSAVFLDVLSVSPSLVTATSPINFENNNTYSVFGRIYSGSYSDLTGEAGNISEPLRYADPNNLDYSIGVNSISASAAKDGGPLGWQPFGLHALPIPRTHLVPSEFPSIQQALNAAQFGDTVLVSSGTFEESISIPDGVWIRSVSGPLHTIIKKPTSVVPTDNRVGVWAVHVGRRTVFSGFTIHGFEIGIETDTTSGLVAVNWISDATDCDTGCKVTYAPIGAVGNSNGPFIAENTIGRATTGILIESGPEARSTRRPQYCRLDIPVPGFVAPPLLPWVHHNAVVFNTRGIELIGSTGAGKAPIRLPFAHNDVFPDPERGGATWINLPDMEGYHQNFNSYPDFRDSLAIPNPFSPLHSRVRPDKRRVGALDGVIIDVTAEIDGQDAGRVQENLTVRAGSNVVLNIRASDSFGYMVLGVESVLGGQLDTDPSQQGFMKGTYTFSVPADLAQDASETVTIIATGDGYREDRRVITVNMLGMLAENHPPTLELSPAEPVVKVGETAVIEITATDIDGDVLSFSSVPPDAGVFGSVAKVGNTSRINFEFTATEPGEITIQITADDGMGGTSAISLKITVQAAPTAARDNIVVSQGYGGVTANKIVRATDLRRITNFPGLPRKFAEILGTSRQRSANTAVADIDGDGVRDVVVGFGPGGLGSISPSIMVAWSPVGGAGGGPRVITTRGAFSPSSRNALLRNPHGAINLAVGNFVGDALPMIVAAQGLGGSNQIRVLQYTRGAGRGKLEYVGLFQGLAGEAVRGNSSGGTSVAAGDLDGDSLDELVVGQMNGTGARTLFQVLDLHREGDQVAVLRRTAPVPAMPPAFRGLGGVNLAVGDVNGDGDNEIITATAGIPNGANNPALKSFVRVFDVVVDSRQRVAGIRPMPGMYPVRVFGASQNPSGGIDVAAGNLDDDLADEVLVSTQAIILVDEVTGDVSFTHSAPRAFVKGLNFEFDVDGVFTGVSQAIPRFEAFGGDFAPLSGAVNVTIYRTSEGAPAD